MEEGKGNQASQREQQLDLARQYLDEEHGNIKGDIESISSRGIETGDEGPKLRPAVQLALQLNRLDTGLILARAHIDSAGFAKVKDVIGVEKENILQEVAREARNDVGAPSLFLGADKLIKKILSNGGGVGTVEDIFEITMERMKEAPKIQPEAIEQS